jgi:hypothetical protein
VYKVAKVSKNPVKSTPKKERVAPNFDVYVDLRGGFLNSRFFEKKP